MIVLRKNNPSSINAMETSKHPAEIFYIPLILVNVIVKVQEADIFF